MGYINFRIDKIKGAAQATAARYHNQRIAFCENTDPSRHFMNKQIMPCVEDYHAFYKERLSSSPQYQHGKKPRADAVQMIDLAFRVSAEEMQENPHFDLDKFCEEIKAFVCDTFGEENVADMVLHMDEGYGVQDGEPKFAPHIHAVVVPMTKDGRLSAREYIGSPPKLKAMQTEVADRLKDMHLKRGLERSVARHVEMKDYYGWVHAARVVDLPEPGEHETARQYATRIKPELQKMQSQHLNEALKLQRARDEALTRVRQLEAGLNTDEAELKRAREELERRQNAIKERERQFAADYKAMQEWKDVLRGLNIAGIAEDDRKLFIDIAGKALEAGQAAREAEERQLHEQENMVGPAKTETK